MKYKLKYMVGSGIEPGTPASLVRCSICTTELFRLTFTVILALSTHWFHVAPVVKTKTSKLKPTFNLNVKQMIGVIVFDTYVKTVHPDNYYTPHRQTYTHILSFQKECAIMSYKSSRYKITRFCITIVVFMRTKKQYVCGLNILFDKTYKSSSSLIAS